MAKSNSWAYVKEGDAVHTAFPESCCLRDYALYEGGPATQLKPHGTADEGDACPQSAPKCSSTNLPDTCGVYKAASGNVYDFRGLVKIPPATNSFHDDHFTWQYNFCHPAACGSNKDVMLCKDADDSGYMHYEDFMHLTGVLYSEVLGDGRKAMGFRASVPPSNTGQAHRSIEVHCDKAVPADRAEYVSQTGWPGAFHVVLRSKAGCPAPRKCTVGKLAPPPPTCTANVYVSQCNVCSECCKPYYSHQDDCNSCVAKQCGSSICSANLEKCNTCGQCCLDSLSNHTDDCNMCQRTECSQPDDEGAAAAGVGTLDVVLVIIATVCCMLLLTISGLFAMYCWVSSSKQTDAEMNAPLVSSEGYASSMQQQIHVSTDSEVHCAVAVGAAGTIPQDERRGTADSAHDGQEMEMGSS